MKLLYVDGDVPITELRSRIDTEFPDAEILDAESVQVAQDTLNDASIDCIIAGLQSGEHNTRPVLRFLEDHSAQIPTILFTAEGSEEIASAATKVGIYRYIMAGREDSVSNLCKAIHQAISSNRRSVNELHRSTDPMTSEISKGHWLHPFHRRLQSIVNVIADIFQYSEHAAALIRCGHYEVVCPNYTSSDWEITARQVTDEGTRVIVKAVYLEKPPVGDDPFLEAEKQFIQAISGLIRDSLNGLELTRENAIEDM